MSPGRVCAVERGREETESGLHARRRRAGTMLTVPLRLRLARSNDGVVAPLSLAASATRARRARAGTFNGSVLVQPTPSRGPRGDIARTAAVAFSKERRGWGRRERGEERRGRRSKRSLFPQPFLFCHRAQNAPDNPIMAAADASSLAWNMSTRRSRAATSGASICVVVSLFCCFFPTYLKRGLLNVRTRGPANNERTGSCARGSNRRSDWRVRRGGGGREVRVTVSCWLFAGVFRDASFSLLFHLDATNANNHTSHTQSILPPHTPLLIKESRASLSLPLLQPPDFSSLSNARNDQLQNKKHVRQGARPPSAPPA
jgi:hypothetical protein